jgi:hypothetical protein
MGDGFKIPELSLWRVAEIYEPIHELTRSGTKKTRSVRGVLCAFVDHLVPRRIGHIFRQPAKAQRLDCDLLTSEF